MKTVGKAVKRGSPVEIRRGSFVAKIYSKTRLISGRRYEVSTLAYYDPSGKRVLRDFGDMAKARQAANDAASAFGLGRPDALQFTPEERQRFDAAERLLDPLGLDVYSTASELVEARRHLPAGSSIAEAVAYYVSRHPANAPTVLVSEAIKALAKDRTEAKCSEQYVTRLEQGLAKFAEAFRCPLAAVSAPQVADWQRALKGPRGEPLGNRTRKNYFGHVVTLFRYAQSRRWVSRDLADEIAGLPQAKVEAAGEVGVFTAAEIRRLLESADPDSLPLIAIGAFAGLRTAELVRLEWQDIRLAERVIVIGAAKAKTASRRVVPITDNLAAWLAPVVQREGSLAEGLDDRIVTQRWTRLASQLGIPWKHNGLRHSFCSYRLAVTHDPAKVAFEAGNSPSMIHRHYRALVTEAQGKGWFNVAPPSGQADVVPMKAGGAS